MDQQRCSLNLSVQPSRGLMDEQFTVCLVENAPPGAQLTLYSLHCNNEGDKWEAYGHYIADATGTVNVSEDPSLGGTYSRVEPMGLIWSLRTVPHKALLKYDAQTPLELSISVYLGHRTEGFKEEEQLASVLVERWFMAPGVKRIPITEQDLTATLFLPPGPGPFPGIIDLWGGGKRLWEYRAALLASHGFAAMALNFTTPEIAVRTRKLVDNSYFEKAYEVLQQHPQVISSRIGMFGLCLGGSMILKMAAYSEVMKLSCAVSINGSHNQRPDGSLKDIQEFFEKNQYKGRLSEDKMGIWRDLQLPIPTDLEHKVDVGRVQCPLLLIAGEDDQNYPAYECVLDMKEMMEKAGNSHLLTMLSYPKAGHRFDVPYMPHDRASVYKPINATRPYMTLWGGEPESHCLAQDDAWKKTLAFLKSHLFNNKTYF